MDEDRRGALAGDAVSHEFGKQRTSPRKVELGPLGGHLGPTRPTTTTGPTRVDVADAAKRPCGRSTIYGTLGLTSTRSELLTYVNTPKELFISSSTHLCGFLVNWTKIIGVLQQVRIAPWLKEVSKSKSHVSDVCGLLTRIYVEKPRAKKSDDLRLIFL